MGARPCLHESFAGEARRKWPDDFRPRASAIKCAPARARPLMQMSVRRRANNVDSARDSSSRESLDSLLARVSTLESRSADRLTAGRHLPAANRCGADWPHRTRRPLGGFVCSRARFRRPRPHLETRRHPSRARARPIHHHRRVGRRAFPTRRSPSMAFDAKLVVAGAFSEKRATL